MTRLTHRFPTRLFAIVAVLMLLTSSVPAAEKLKLLIIDGQNNHQWKKTTPVMRAFLEKSGRFTVSVSTSPARGGTEAAWAAFRPAFAANDVVLSNYNGQPWPKPVQSSLEKYVSGGGGLVIVHGEQRVSWLVRVEQDDRVGLASGRLRRAADVE